MQMVKKIIVTIFVIWFAVLLFMPKKEIYYTIEKALQREGIVINEKSISTGIFSLTLNDSEIYVKGIYVAKIKKINIFTMLFYTKADLEGLTIDDSLLSYVPKEIEMANAVYSIFNPQVLSLDINGSFGVAEGNMDFSKRKVRIDILDKKDISTFKSILKQNDKGVYYETSF